MEVVHFLNGAGISVAWRLKGQTLKVSFLSQTWFQLLSYRPVGSQILTQSDFKSTLHAGAGG